jgi:dihydrofolate reductase
MKPRIVLYIAASLDGYIARRDGSIDWLPKFDAHDARGWREFFARIGTVAMGRRTYDAARELDVDENPFPDRRCVVFSRRRSGRRVAGLRFVTEQPADYLRRLRDRAALGDGAADNRDVWLAGGGEIVREALEAGLVNEIVLTLVPVLLGDGVPLFPPRGGTSRLELAAMQRCDGGLVQLTYRLASRTAGGASEMRHAAESPRPELADATAAFGAEIIRAALRRRAA